MSCVRAYAQLVRLPNVFTALADICLGALAGAAATGTAAGWPRSVWLLGSSACLYSAGMVWNDYFDLEQDRRERPFRPLPSGRVRPGAAARLGTTLLAAGLVLATASGWTGAGLDWTPALVAVALAAAILLYDAWLKRTWAGPLGMGACRFLNVLLGLTPFLAAGPWRWGVHMAAAVGIYIVGVTWFARTEARASRRAALGGGAAVMAAGLLLALLVPVWFPPGTTSPLFPYLLAVLGLLVGIPAGNAIAQPTPGPVQAAVKRAILGLVVLDATLATALAGVAGLAILILLAPALYLGRWIYST